MSNKQIPAWEFKAHSYQIADTGDYDGHYELTNGDITLWTKDDDDETERLLRMAAHFLNKVGINLSDAKVDDLSFQLHLLELEKKQLQERVSELEAAGSEASGYIEFLDVQNNRLRKVLFELVRLKDRKDKEGNFIGYERLKQIAWEEAREVVKDLNNPAKLTKERADLIREANNRDLDGAAVHNLQQELALSKEVNKEALALTEKAQQRLQDLRDKGDKLALAARRLALSMTVHPDNEPNSEFAARIQGVWDAEKEWSGEKEVKLEPPAFEINEGLEFLNVHMPDHLFIVRKVLPEINQLWVWIANKTKAGECWTEKDWNLEHTQWAFEKGEYFIEKEVKGADK